MKRRLNLSLLIYKSTHVAFSKEKVEQMWEQWKAGQWSNSLDERDLGNARVEFNALE